MIWFYFIALPYFIIVSCFLCMIGMANLITVPILECITGWFFIITQEVVVANTLFGPVLHSFLFDDAKRVKIKLTMLV